MRSIILSLVFIFFTSILSAQTVIQKQKPDKQYHSKSIKKANTKNNNLIKVQEESISTSKYTGEVKQKQIISKSNKQSSKIKMINPTTVTHNTSKTKVEESKKYKLEYQKRIKNKEVEDE